MSSAVDLSRHTRGECRADGCCCDAGHLASLLDTRGETVASLKRTIVMMDTARERREREYSAALADLTQRLHDSRERCQQLAEQLAPLLALDAIHTAQLARR